MKVEDPVRGVFCLVGSVLHSDEFVSTQGSPILDFNSVLKFVLYGGIFGYACFEDFEGLHIHKLGAGFV